MTSPDNPKWLQLQARFHERLKRELALLQSYSPLANTTFKQAERHALQQQAHGLAGIGGVFGYDEISTHALALEECLLKGQDTQDINAALQILIAGISAVLQSNTPPNHV